MANKEKDIGVLALACAIERMTGEVGIGEFVRAHFYVRDLFETEFGNRVPSRDELFGYIMNLATTTAEKEDGN